MECPNCHRSNPDNYFFCRACRIYMNDPAQGKMAGLFGRWVAVDVLDPLIFLLTVSIAWWIGLAKGTTPGHALLGHRILKTDGSKPGFGTMFFREVIGKFVSGLMFGLGFFWAIWDDNRQAWHDKMADTVVLRGRPTDTAALAAPE